jgi:hypothetical protein
MVFLGEAMPRGAHPIAQLISNGRSIMASQGTNKLTPEDKRAKLMWRWNFSLSPGRRLSIIFTGCKGQVTPSASF